MKRIPKNIIITKMIVFLNDEGYPVKAKMYYTYNGKDVAVDLSKNKDILNYKDMLCNQENSTEKKLQDRHMLEYHSMNKKKERDNNGYTLPPMKVGSSKLGLFSVSYESRNYKRRVNGFQGNVMTLSSLLENPYLTVHQSKVKKIITYCKPDKNLVSINDINLTNDYRRTQRIFGELLDEKVRVSAEDIGFFVNYLIFLSINNSDCKYNKSFTKLNMALPLINAHKGIRNHAVEDRISSILMGAELDYNKIFNYHVLSKSYHIDEKKSHDYFAYLYTLFGYGEIKKKSNINVVNRVDIGIFHSLMTSLEKLLLYCPAYGLLVGKENLHLNSMFDENGFVKMLQSKIFEEKERLIQEQYQKKTRKL